MHLSLYKGRKWTRWGFDFFLKLTANRFPTHGQIILVKCARIQSPNRNEDRGQISQGGNNNKNKNGDKHPIHPHQFWIPRCGSGIPVLDSKILDSTQWVPDSRYWILNFSSVELGFQNPVVSEIPFFLSWIPFQVPKPRISDSLSKTFLDFGIRIILHLI